MPLSITGATTVKVNPDCTGLMTWNLKSQGADLGKNQHFMVVLDGGNLAWGLEISNPNGPSAMLATWERVSPIPAVVK